MSLSGPEPVRFEPATTTTATTLFPLRARKLPNLHDARPDAAFDRRGVSTARVGGRLVRESTHRERDRCSLLVLDSVQGDPHRGAGERRSGSGLPCALDVLIILVARVVFLFP